MNIPLKWTGKQIDNFRMPIEVERVSWFSKFNDWLEGWFMYFVLAVMIGGTVWLAYMIYQVNQLMVWLHKF